MTRPALRLLALGAAVGATAACFELSGPGDGIFSIDPLQLPSSAVAKGDSLRDSTGRAVPLRLAAYDKDGNPIDSVTVRFLALDRGITVLPGGYVLGDSIRTDARLVAQVGSLQTASVPLDVTVPPDTALDSALVREQPYAIVAAVTGTDSLFAAFGLQVLAADRQTKVANWPVRFAIASSTVKQVPDSSAPVALVSGGTPAREAVTDANGWARLQLRLRPRSMDPTRLAQKAVDTVTVRTSTVVGVGAGAHALTRTYTFVLRPQ